MAAKDAVVAVGATAKEKYAGALAALADAWPGEDEKADDGAASTVSVSQASETLKWARKKYDALVRWVVAVFSAIGLLVFGSVPFVDLAFVNMLAVSLGLILAGVGLAIVIYATTRALEPEDASLSELSATLREATQHRGATHPRWEEAARLAGILAGDTGAAFGPGITSPDALLREIARREANVLALETGWSPGRDEAPPPPEIDDASAADVGKAMRSHVQSILDWLPNVGGVSADNVWRLSGGDEQLTKISSAEGPRRGALILAWHKVLTSTAIEQAFPNRGAASSALVERVKQLLNVIDSRKDPKQSAAALRAALETEAELGGRIAKQRAILDNRLWHRNLVLDESGVSQLRGTFRIVRRLLMLGAASVLAGGVIYAWAVANPAPGGLRTPVAVDIFGGTDSATALTSCGITAEEGITAAAGTLISISDPEDPSSEFRVLLADTKCAGTVVQVAAGEGRVALRAESGAAADPDTETTDGPAVRHLAAITAAAGTPEWAAIVDACELTAVSRDDDLAIRGYVRVQGSVTGLAPFSADVVCENSGALVTLDFATEGGAYTLP